jgi:hypothetical protein
VKMLWLVSRQDDFSALSVAGEDVCYLSDLEKEGGSLLQGRDVAVLAPGDMAKAEAMSLRARGVQAKQLNYVDLRPGDTLRQRIQRPRHLLWDDVCTLRELDGPEDFKVYPANLDFLDRPEIGWGWRLPELVVMAGAYGSGKSTVGQMLAAGFASGPGVELGSGAMLCSWEDIGAEVRRNFAAFGEARDCPDILDRVSFVRRHPDADRLLSWYMELVEYHRDRFGTRFFVLDPWNEMDHVKDSRVSETDYVRDMMKALRRLVDRLGIILVVATHVPAKVIKGDGAIEPFRIGHAFGSVQFANKADRGICVLRSKKYDQDKGHTILRIDKVKVERRMGKKSTIAMVFNSEHFQVCYDKKVTGEVKEIWRD